MMRFSVRSVRCAAVMMVLALAMLALAGCGKATPAPAPTPAPAVPLFDDDEAAIRWLLATESRGVVNKDMDLLAAIWAEDAVVIDAKHTPDAPADDARWQGLDAVLDRYVTLVFPGNPTVAAPADVQIIIDGDRAEAVSTTRINDELSPGGDKWTFVKRDGRWFIQSLTYNLEPEANSAMTSPLLTPVSPPTAFPIPTSSSSPVPTAIVGSAMPTARQALTLMYGDRAYVIDDHQAMLTAPADGYTTTVHINTMGCYWEENEEKCLVITDQAFDHAHITQAQIDGALFLRQNGVWRMELFRPRLAELGSFGYVPKGSLIYFGPDRRAALIHSYWQGQGSEEEHITIFAQIGDEIKVIFDQLVNASFTPPDGGAALGPGWGYGSRLEFEENEKSDYYTIVLTQFGTGQEGDYFRRDSVFLFEDGRYVLASRHDW